MPNDPHIRPTVPLTIDILAFQNVQLLDIAGPLQVFATVNELSVGEGRPAPYRPTVVATDPAIMTSSGLGVTASPLPGSDEPVDTFVIAGGSGVHTALQDRSLVKWVCARARHSRRIASVCTGAFLLAEAGLLEGRRAVTHWTRCAELSARYPASRVETDAIFIVDGPVWTSAGITAGIDLCLALVEQDLGNEMALAAARQLVMFLKRPGGQAQFSTTLALQTADATFAALHGWMRDNLARDLSVGVLAAQAGMSGTQFQPALSRCDRNDPVPRRRASPRRSGARSPAPDRAAGQAHRRTLRLRIGRDTPAQLRKAARKHTAGLPSAVRVGISGERLSRK